MPTEKPTKKPEKKPIEIWVSGDGEWRWEVLRKYQKPENEAKNPYARWLCRVYSPMTGELFPDIGDTYVRDVVRYARKLEGQELANYMKRFEEVPA